MQHAFRTPLFAPPRLLRMPGAGVDVSDRSLKYLSFAHDMPPYELGVWGTQDIPLGVIERGVVQDHDAFVDILKTVARKLSTPYVHVSLPEERAYIFETTIERGAAADEIRDTLEFRMEENVPLSPRDALFDYEIIEETDADAPLRVAVSVYAREIITQYCSACAAAGLFPLSLEVEAEATARAVVPPDEDAMVMVLDFGRARTGLGLMQSGSLLYTSTIDIGGDTLDAALREDTKTADLSEDELIKLKNEHGLLASEDDDAVYDILLPSVSALKDEIQTRISYWNTREIGNGDRAVEHIMLCGGGANLAGLPEYLTETLGIEVSRAYVWQQVYAKGTQVPAIPRRESYGYATAIGLACRSAMRPEL